MMFASRFLKTCFSAPLAMLLVCTLLSTAVDAAQFIPLGFLSGHTTSEVRGVSDDGTVAAGTSYITGGAKAFRWTEATGMVSLGALPGRKDSAVGGGYAAGAISGDGSTIVGSSYNATGGAIREAFFHSPSQGMQGIGGLVAPLPAGYESAAVCAAYDGSVIAGFVRDTLGNWEVFRWTEANGMVGLGRLPGRADLISVSYDMSADGSILVGESANQAFVWRSATGMQGLGVAGAAISISPEGNVIGGQGYVSSISKFEAFRWDEEASIVGLGWLPDKSEFSAVRGISANGNVIVGSSQGLGPASERETISAFIWTADRGMQDLQQLLIDEYGLGPSLAGWTLRAPQNISANGQFIVGNGINPDGAEEAWLLRLDAPPLAGDFNSTCWAIVTSDAAGTHIVTPGVPAYGINLDSVAIVGGLGPFGPISVCTAALVSDRHLLSPRTVLMKMLTAAWSRRSGRFSTRLCFNLPAVGWLFPTTFS